MIAANVSGDRAAGVTWRIVSICAGFAVIALIGAFAGRVQRWLDRRFFREAYNTEQILSDLANQVRRIVDTGSRVIASADAFAAGAKQHDDMTLIVARILCS